MRILSLDAWFGTRYAELKEFLSSQLDATDIFCFQESNGNGMEQILEELFDVRDSRSLTRLKPLLPTAITASIPS